MRIIVSDSSCLIDLRKAALLAVFLRLPYEILIPDTLFEDELLSFTDVEKKTLLDSGLKVIDLPGERVSRAREVIRARPRLSIHDGFAFALAEGNTGCVLLTGDAQLRALAESSRIEAHGILWVFDEIHKNRLADGKALHAALVLLGTDPAVRLPKRELTVYMKRYEEDSQ
jgi:predicted nucleic acid-binding protein